MSIIYSPETKQFQLNTNKTSYVMQVQKDRLQHLYWGDRLPDKDHTFMRRDHYHSSFNANDEVNDFGFSLDVMRMEYPCYGRGEMRPSAFEMTHPDGSSIADPVYIGHQITVGKEVPKGLPSCYAESEAECETLEILLEDKPSSVVLHLFYCIFEAYNAIVRFVRVENKGQQNVVINKLLSASLDLDVSDLEMISNYGAWARERNIERHKIFHGTQEIFSRRGASSHTHNPFLILCDPSATESVGDVYGMTLVYSGSFEGTVYLDSFEQTRMAIGLQHEGFAWQLAPGEMLDSPEAVLVYSHDGLGGLSDDYHRLFRERLCRGIYRDQRRPVLLNCWEACYFNFDEEKIVSIAKEAAQMGVELIVVDDGWFGKRDQDNCSLGDWTPNPKKLPGGVKGLAEKVRAAGCELGIWFEPEMISPDSDLYRAHPEWVLSIPGRPRSLGRWQMILDLSRKDVQDYLFDSIASVIGEGNISYVKWDFNRNFSEVGSALLSANQQGEVAHRYYLGLYALLERLNRAFPQVLFESCSGGGGRFDAGLLPYMPQAWTSDNTDAIKRLWIQYGSSFVYPLSSMSAHVSICPNHQTGEASPFQTRVLTALTGSFGFELNPFDLNAKEKEEFAAAISLYKELGDLLCRGRYHRLSDPDKKNYAAWNYQSVDEREIFAVAVCHRSVINGGPERFRLFGLKKGYVYQSKTDGHIYSAEELTQYGLQLPYPMKERQAAFWHLKAI